ncbi:Reverse transcriptase domain [Trinorchestia longiramus]|nr:Reverse transcriptase domain [Trinorchestia longiramus]
MIKHYEDVPPFLSVPEIGAWKIKCFLAANQITSVGAIRPFGEDTSREELTEALIDAGFEVVTVEHIYIGVLYKLGSCEVREPILRWLHLYLTNRFFQVYFECFHSSVRRAKSGNSQGGIMSPMLFNLIMSDIPIQTRVLSYEYADDRTDFTAHEELHVATDKHQIQMNYFYKWSHQ